MNDAVSDGTSLEDVVKEFKPTCLLSLAAQPAGLFTDGMVRGMVEYTDYPIVMPMSNPTAKAECTPQQAYEWTDGKAIVATGSRPRAVVRSSSMHLLAFFHWRSDSR